MSSAGRRNPPGLREDEVLRCVFTGTKIGSFMLPLIEAFKKDLYHCADCNYCVEAVWPERGIDHVCPTMQHHTAITSFSGRGYIAAARAWMEGAVLDLDALGERVFSCTTCGNCEQVCPIGLHPTAVGRAIRGELWAREQVPVAVKSLHQDMQRDGNPNGIPRAARGQWADALPAAAGALAPVLYLPGCAAATTLPDEARAACALLAIAGHPVETLAHDDTCCGAPLRELGLDDEAEFMIAALASRIGTTHRVVTSGLECMHSWTRSANTHLTGFTAWLAEALREGRLRPRAKASLPTIRLLDSCQSRQTQTHHHLREILTLSGMDFVATSAAPSYVVCCGAAGGMPRMQPASVARMASARVDGSSIDSDVWVSADPRCVAHIRQAAPSRRVFGIAECLLAHCEFGE
jgi:fumarate reductase (CoM/CoB) subunit B